MKALQFLQSEQRLEIHDVTWPVITSPDDIIVRVAFAGVCGTDLHTLAGSLPMAARWLTMGHELSGVVDAVGAAVTSVAVGDRVAVDPNLSCGVCRSCKLGDVHFCPTGGINSTLGFWRDGGWAEATVVPERCVNRLPTVLPLCTAVLCEPLSCLLHLFDLMTPGATAHGTVLVLGAGIIGVLTSCLLHHRGVRDVTVSDPAPARRHFVEGLQLGYRVVTPAELAASFAAQTEMQIATDGLGLVIDCSGCCDAVEEAAGWLRRGGAVHLFGIPPPEGRITLSPYQLVTRELSVKSAVGNPHTLPRATELALRLGERYLELGKLGVQVFPLEQHHKAMQKLKMLEISKAVFALDGTLE